MIANICHRKFCCYDEISVRSHEISFLKNLDTLYGLLKDLITSKVQTTNANADQIKFIVYLMMGYCDKDLFIEETKIYKEKRGSWQNNALNMARIILWKSKEKPLTNTKAFFPKKN